MTFLPISDRLSGILADSFEQLEIPRSYAVALVSDRPDLADWQCNGALAAAKEARKPPRQIAELVAAQLKDEPAFASVSVAGPGFINLVLADDFLWGVLDEQLATDALGIQQVEAAGPIVIDFGGPNIAKPLHVGHLRSLLIGESIRRTLVASGHEVISDIHLGDWGLQMGMLITEAELCYPSLPQLSAPPPYPPGLPFGVAEMEAMYTRAAAACKADPARLDSARSVTARLQAGDPGYRALWSEMRKLSLEHVMATINELGAEFTLTEGESDVASLIDPMVRELRDRGVATESQGAIVIDLESEADTAPVPPLLLTKADGAALYSTTDLATIKDRYGRHRPARILYVVDARQSLHFEQVFRAARRAGLAPDVDLVHIGFGTVNGRDNRPYKTREGGVMRLDDLLAEATAKARERIDGSEQAGDLGEAEQAALSRSVGIAAIKYTDLSSYRMSGYIFDPDRMVSFEGKTGPYLQYACVRIASLLEKAGDESNLKPQQLRLDSEGRAVILECLRMPEIVRAAAEAFAPNQIAEHAYLLAQKFSRFYTNCPILSEPDQDLRRSRMKIAAAAYKVLAKELWLLGLHVPARM